MTKYWRIIVGWLKVKLLKIIELIKRIPAWSTRNEVEPVVVPSSQTEQPAGTPPTGGNGNNSTTPPVPPDEPRENRFTPFDFVSIIVNLAFFVFSLFVSVIGVGIQNLTIETFGIVLLVLQVWHILESVKIVNFGEQAILLVLGRIIKAIKPDENSYGIVYVPYGIALLLRAPTGIIEKDLPADPRLIWHGDATKGDGKVPRGYFPPIRVTFAPNPGQEVKFTDREGTERKIPKNDAYFQRNTAEIEASYGWQIEDLGLLIRKFGYKQTLSKAQGQMDDTAIGVFNDIFPQMTEAEAMTRMKKTSDEVMRALTDESDDWGITVAFFRVKPFGNSHAVNKAVSQEAESLPKMQAVINESEGEKIRLRNIGIGNGDSEYEVLSGRAEGEMELAEVAATPGGQYAMAIQAVQRGLETAKAVIVPQDNLFGSVAGITKMIEQISNVTPFPPTPPSPPAQSGTSQQRPTQNQQTPPRVAPEGRRRHRSNRQ